MNLIPFRAKLVGTGCPDDLALHTPYVMFEPTATIAERMWMNLSAR